MNQTGIYDYLVTGQFPADLLVLAMVLMLWELVWKAFGMWRAARRGNSVWFILMLVFNTVGILPIIYLLLTRTSKAKPARKPKRKR